MAINLTSLWHWLFWLAAIVASLFYGIKACTIFEVAVAGKPTAWRLHQFWFNFIGAITGWIAAWPLVGAAFVCANSGCPTEVSASSVALFLLAFIGITGHLPLAVFGLLGGLKELVAKLLSAGGGK